MDGSAYRELSWLIYLATLAFTNRSSKPLEILRGLYLELYICNVICPTGSHCLPEKRVRNEDCFSVCMYVGRV